MRKTISSCWKPTASLPIYFVFLILILNGLIRAEPEICGSKEDFLSRVVDVVKVRSTPQAGSKAGTYSSDVAAIDEIDCIRHCCSNPTCDVMLFHLKSCYHISCNRSVVSGCDPMRRSDNKFKDTFMANIRPVDYLTAPVSSALLTEPVSCTFGLFQCPHNEECILFNSRSRSGHCNCKKGFDRDKSSNICSPYHGSQSSHEGSSSNRENPVPVATRPSIVNISKVKKNNLPSVDFTKPAGNQPTIKSILPIVVSAGDNQTLRLPIDHTTLTANSVPKNSDGSFKYNWILLSHPDSDQVGIMEGKSSKTLKVSKLIAGLYCFKVTVSAEGKYGESFVNVTVLPPLHVNRPPVAVVKPAYQTISESNDLFIDGSESSDDNGVVKYHWDIMSSPLGVKPADESTFSKPILNLKEMKPGEYVIKLTVTDAENLENYTLANVTVKKETDFPPKANAGSNIIMSLPQKSAVLCGNMSTDDKGIVSYEWIKESSEKLTADQKGVRKPCLHLDNLEVGDYKYRLKVTDTIGQIDTAEVHVYVKKQHNKPPVASAGKQKVVFLPTDTVTLDGSNSTDDKSITIYQWTQISGPGSVQIDNSDRAVATASGLVLGVYQFKLTVKDEEQLESSATTTITVKHNKNQAPIARAGGDRVLSLPVDLVSLDGTGSSDDRQITSYIWTRKDISLAVGDVLNGSDHSPVLLLTNLVEGRYSFDLTVSDAEGLSSVDTASILVNPDPHEKDLVELHLDSNSKQLTELNKKSLVNQISLLLHNSHEEGETVVRIVHIEQTKATKHIIIKFLVENIAKDEHVIQDGRKVMLTLKQLIKANPDVLDFNVLHLDTIICQNNCSGHGVCDQSTKHCVCEPFWTEDIIRYYLLDKESNCDWSVLYVIIVAFIAVIVFVSLIWSCVCLYRRCYKFRPKKRHRYKLLEDDKEVELSPQGHRRNRNSTIMVSESDITTDEETLFITHSKSKANGHIKNGLTKPQKQKVKT